MTNQGGNKISHMSTLPQLWNQTSIHKGGRGVSPPSKEEQQYVRQVLGTFLFYARGVDGILITPLSAITGEQAKLTVKTLVRVKQLLDYIASQDDAVLTYRVSDMVLAMQQYIISQ